MSNTIKIKHGNTIPNGKLAPYELGYCDADGNLYIGGPLKNNEYGEAIAITVQEVEYAQTAGKLENTQNIQIDVGSNVIASFDGSVVAESGKANIIPGVTGVLSIGNGGTGASSADNALKNLGIQVTASEINKLSGIGSSTVATQLGNKLDKTASTANMVMISDANKAIVPSSISSTKLGYLANVTSDIQAQINELGRVDITGGASTIVTSNLTASRALTSNTDGKVAVSAVTSTELGYLSGVTSAIQTQLDEKAGNSYTASRALVSNSSGKIAASDVTSTELGYLDGVTSAIQTQLNNKVGKATASTGQSASGTSNITVITMGNLVIEHGYFSADENWTVKYFKTEFAEAPALSFIPTGSNAISQVKLQNISSVTKNGFVVSTPSESATYIYMAIGRKA